MFRLKGSGLQLDNHITFQARVIEKQVNKELIVRHLQPKLPPDKGKTRPQLQQETGDVANQATFNVALVGIVAQPEEVEKVGVF